MTGNSFELREATSADVPALASVIAAAFEVYRDKLTPPSSSLSKTPEAVRLELQTATAIVAVQATTLVGCVFYQANNDHVYLSRLAVLPAYQGEGTARALLLTVEERSLNSGHDKVRLQVRLVQERNRALYASCGYKVHSYGSHAGYEEPTFVMLEKRLNFLQHSEKISEFTAAFSRYD